MTGRRSAGVLSLAATVLCTASLVSRPLPAQPPADVAADTDAAALYQYGKERYAADDIVGAFEAYHRSCTIQPTMEACANAGNAADRLGRYATAATLLRSALALVPPMLEHEPARKKVRTRLTEVRAKCGALLIEAKPAGAIILVDDDRVGTAPMDEPMFVNTGAHRVMVQLDGYQSATHTLEVSQGATTRWPVALIPVNASADEGVDVRMGVGIGGLAMGAVGIAVGVGLFLAADAEVSAAELLRANVAAADPNATSPCSDGAVLIAQCGELQNTQDAYNALRGGSAAAFALGGVAAVTGLIVLLTGAESGNVEVGPVLAPGRAGAHLRVRF